MPKSGEVGRPQSCSVSKETIETRKPLPEGCFGPTEYNIRTFVGIVDQSVCLVIVRSIVSLLKEQLWTRPPYSFGPASRSQLGCII